MKQLISRLERHGIGVRALNEADFWQIVESENITVLNTDAARPFSLTVLGRKFISLPRHRNGLRLLFSMFHELAHLLLMNGKEPHLAFQDLDASDDKTEAEADAIALVALIPKHLIRELSSEFGLTRYGNKIWQERCRLYFLYGI